VASRCAYLSSDGGQIWRRLRLPRGFLLSAGFRGDSTGYLVLAPRKDAAAGLFLWQGKSGWREVHAGVAGAALGPGGDIYAFTDRDGRAMLLASADGGKTWTTRSLPAAVQPIAIGAAADGTLWLQGLSKFWYSRDQGTRWREVSVGAGGLLGVSLASWRRWLVLVPQGIYATDDAGGSWRAKAGAPVLQGPGVP
jgi:hypothetical protein